MVHVINEKKPGVGRASGGQLLFDCVGVACSSLREGAVRIAALRAKIHRVRGATGQATRGHNLRSLSSCRNSSSFLPHPKSLIAGHRESAAWEIRRVWGFEQYIECGGIMNVAWLLVNLLPREGHLHTKQRRHSRVIDRRLSLIGAVKVLGVGILESGYTHPNSLLRPGSALLS